MTYPLVAQFRLCHMEYRIWNMKYEMRLRFEITFLSPLPTPHSPRPIPRFLSPLPIPFPHNFDLAYALPNTLAFAVTNAFYIAQILSPSLERRSVHEGIFDTGAQKPGHCRSRR